MSLSRSGLILTLLVCFLGSACQPKPDSAQAKIMESTTLVDALGRPYLRTASVGRVLTIAPGATELVVAGGGLSKIVGVSNVDSSPPAVLSLPTYSVLPLDFEAVVALQPDLVFASAGVNDPQLVRVFESLGIDVFYLDDSTWDAVHNSVGVVGELLSTQQDAARSQADLSSRIDSLRKLTTAISHKPKSVFLVHESTSYSFGKGSYVLDLFEWAGLESATAMMDTPAPVLSDEWMLMEDPEIIFGAFGEGFVVQDLLDHHPTWKNLTAIRNGQVFTVPQDLILRPGPNNVRAAYLMAEYAHPDLFTPGDH